MGQEQEAGDEGYRQVRDGYMEKLKDQIAAGLFIFGFVALVIVGELLGWWK